MCQCPQSGDTHFYEELHNASEQVIMGVNALNRAILISTSHLFNVQPKNKSCVNALSRAILISTMQSRRTRVFASFCVNALNRAILISTLPFWNQLFKPLSGLVSTGIFSGYSDNYPK